MFYVSWGCCKKYLLNISEKYYYAHVDLSCVADAANHK